MRTSRHDPLKKSQIFCVYALERHYAIASFKSSSNAGTIL